MHLKTCLLTSLDFVVATHIESRGYKYTSPVPEEYQIIGIQWIQLGWIMTPDQRLQLVKNLITFATRDPVPAWRDIFVVNFTFVFMHLLDEKKYPMKYWDVVKSIVESIEVKPMPNMRMEDLVQGSPCMYKFWLNGVLDWRPGIYYPRSFYTFAQQSPLDQFIIGVGECSSNATHWLGFPTWINTLELQATLILTIIFLYLLFKINSTKIIAVGEVSNVTRKLSTFVRELVQSQIESRGIFPYLGFLFVLILTSNAIGMIPYTMTLTSQILMTLGLALMTFIILNFIYIIKQKIVSAELFLPNGAPLFIAPFLIQIEIISYFSRVIILSVRLFANMTSGHTLLKILSGFGTGMISSGGAGLIVALGPILVVFLVSGLELAIAVLQTYVFVVLICIYLHELEHGH